MSPETPGPNLVRRHLRFGWWSILVFLTLGIALEAMHGFKVRWYLDVDNETRRLMWRLAHAHGVLVGLLNVAFACSLRDLAGAGSPNFASRCLLAAGVLLPLGFFLGGIVVWEGDPWLGVLLVPVGALLLLAGVLAVARRA